MTDFVGDIFFVKFAPLFTLTMQVVLPMKQKPIINQIISACRSISVLIGTGFKKGETTAKWQKEMGKKLAIVGIGRQPKEMSNE